jgi:PleD family two-component response regulator
MTPKLARTKSDISMDEALSEADRQLYQAKNTGRDKIVCQDV